MILKKIGLVTLVMLITIELFSQAFIGFKGGYNALRLSADSVMNKELIYGYGGGLVFKQFETKAVGLQFEVNYVQKGWKIITLDSAVYQRTMNYIEIPAFMHLNITLNRTKIYFNAGPELDILVSENSPVTEPLGADLSNERLYNGTLHKLSYGLAGGLGIMQLFSFGAIQLEVRATQSLSKVIKLDELTQFNYPQNQTFGISLAYMHAIGKTRKNKVTD